MALHTELPIYRVAYDLLDTITDLAKNMPRDFKHSLANILRKRGHCISGDITKTYRKGKHT